MLEPIERTHGSSSGWRQLQNLTLVLASLLFGLTLIELALRVLGWTYPIFAHPDAELGWSFRPGVHGWSTHEDTTYIRINRFGFRGPEWSEQPSPNTFRIAVLGDSFVDGSSLPEAETLTGVIERHLLQCSATPARSFEVLNFGVSGYGTAQEYLLLQQRIAAFQPNLVLLAFYVGNDIADNSRPLSVVADKPYFVELPTGEMVHDASFRDSDGFKQAMRAEWQKALINSSYLLQALKQIYSGKPVIPSPINPQVLKVTEAETGAVPQDLRLFGPPPDDAWRRAWSVTEKLLLRMRDWTQAHGMGFRLVIIPAPIEALPGKELRQAAARRFGLADLDYPVERISRDAQQNGILHLSLLGALRAYGDEERAFTYGFSVDQHGEGHLNATGMAVSGRTIATWLCPGTIEK